jgi:hypothetical protein
MKTAEVHELPINLDTIYKNWNQSSYLNYRNGITIHVNLFANPEVGTYTMESELHASNMKMLHNNKQRYKTTTIIRTEF